MSAEQTPDLAAAQVAIRDRLHSLRWHDQGAWPTEVETCAPCDQDADQLAAALAPVLAAAWDEGHAVGIRPYGDHENPYRADRITEPVSHEAATSGEEASKA